MAKSRKLAITVVLLLCVSGGAAIAYWTAGGSGTGSASTATGQTLTVKQTSVISNLQPGGAPQTLSGNFDNPYSVAVHVNTVTVAIAAVVDGVGDPVVGCDATDYTLSGAAMAVNQDVPAGNAQGSWTGATIAFDNDPLVNQDACKGAIVRLTYAIS